MEWNKLLFNLTIQQPYTYYDAYKYFLVSIQILKEFMTFMYKLNYLFPYLIIKNILFII
jgi:hypothetical protein